MKKLMILVVLLGITVVCYSQGNSITKKDTKNGYTVYVNMTAEKDPEKITVEALGQNININWKDKYLFSITATVRDSSDNAVDCRMIQLHARAGNTNVYYPGIQPTSVSGKASHGFSFYNNGPNWFQGGVIVDVDGNTKFSLGGDILRIAAN